MGRVVMDQAVQVPSPDIGKLRKELRHERTKTAFLIVLVVIVGALSAVVTGLAVNMGRQLVKAKKQIVAVEDFRKVFVDQDHVDKVLWNLAVECCEKFENATKASEENGGVAVQSRIVIHGDFSAVNDRFMEAYNLAQTMGYQIKEKQEGQLEFRSYF